MKNHRSHCGILFYMLMGSVALALAAPGTGMAAEFGPVEASVQQYLSEKTKFTGSLDIYDAGIDKVRNLKLINLRRDSLTGEGPDLEIRGDFRDLNSGDIMDVNVMLAEDAGVLDVSEIAILSVKYKKKAVDPEASKKKFTDKEVQEFIKNHIADRSKFGGTYGLFDVENEVYRQLNLIKLADDVRNFGILYINAVEFEDDKTGDKVSVDITLQNKEGELDVKTVRIKKIANLKGFEGPL
ncbi:MAG: hypothetical protein K8I00_00110, partial [Candidatus Omnitrophica bacterium]|nr:hypothetical protein [Candidatus Omnitrophota bacterium]